MHSPDASSPTLLDPNTSSGSDGSERPELLPPADGPSAIERTFAFVDLCGFTHITETEGPIRAVEVVNVFRTMVREVSARRGVRVAKWLGDGAMLVGVTTAPTVATIAELCGRFAPMSLDLRAGITTGVAVLFEGDDYIGRPVNLAARLCDRAERGEILSDTRTARGLPDWVRATRRRNMTVRGVGQTRVANLVADPEVSYPTAAPTRRRRPRTRR